MEVWSEVNATEIMEYDASWRGVFRWRPFSIKPASC
jgi:hypothetical protein